jgi:hypothetical protein
MTVLAQPGHQPPVAVTSKFLVPGEIEWLVFGDQVDRENFRTRPQAAGRECIFKAVLLSEFVRRRHTANAVGIF